MRAHLRLPIQDANGNIQPGSVVQVMQNGISALLNDPLYPDDSSSTNLSNPFTSTDGNVDFYLDVPQRVDLVITAPGQAPATYPDIDVNEPVTAGLALTFPGLGTSSTQVGNLASATQNQAVALGDSAGASAVAATAVGQDAQANGAQSTAVGQDAWAEVPQTVALGASANATGTGAIAVGTDALASGTSAVAEGVNAAAGGPGAVALGSSASASGLNSAAIGAGASAPADNQIVLGTAASTVIVPGTLSATLQASAALTPTSVKTGPYTAATGDLVLVSTSGGNVTITLPTIPADKVQIGVKQVVLGTGNHVTVNAGGTDRFNVAGGASSITLTRVFQTVILQYQLSSGLWLVTGTDPASPIDTTATDIQPNGTQAAGATLMVADAGHVHPLQQRIPSDNALIAYNADPLLMSGNSLAVAGAVYLFKIPVRMTLLMTNLVINTQTAGSGTSTQSFAGLYTSAGSLLTSSSDIGTIVAGTAGFKTLPLTTPQTVTPSSTGGFVWAALLFNLTTAQPTLRGFAGAPGGLGITVMNLGLINTNFAACVNPNTGATSLAATLTLSSNSSGGNAVAWWVGVS
jgi:hypothetical protein